MDTLTLSTMSLESKLSGHQLLPRRLLRRSFKKSLRPLQALARTLRPKAVCITLIQPYEGDEAPFGTL